MTLTSITPETAQAERDRLLGQVRFHKREAKRARIALDLLEADCARVGIRLIRVRPEGRDHHARTDPDDR